MLCLIDSINLGRLLSSLCTGIIILNLESWGGGISSF